MNPLLGRRVVMRTGAEPRPQAIIVDCAKGEFNWSWSLLLLTDDGRLESWSHDRVELIPDASTGPYR